MRPAAFLDRDGVLNRLVVAEERARSPRTLREFQLLPDVARAVETLHRADLLVVVVTNQPDVARGLLPMGELERMHEWLRRVVAVDAIYVCPHDDRDECLCRKPRPGLLLEASREWGIALAGSYLVGDSWKDIEAGRRAGCRTILLGSARSPEKSLGVGLVARDLARAAELIARVQQGVALR
jgi:D-glycero-D-manno-heptose 1,7-bisphosphate phosphatase